MHEFASQSRHISIDSARADLEMAKVNRPAESWARTAKELASMAMVMVEREKGSVRGEGNYVGKSGVALALAKVGMFEEAGEMCGQTRHHGRSPRVPEEMRGPSLLDGIAGVYATRAIVSNAVGDRDEVERNAREYLKIGKESNIDDPSEDRVEDEILVGRSGYILGALGLADLPLLRDSDVRVDLRSMAAAVAVALIERGTAEATELSLDGCLVYSWHNSLYLGAAHGLLGALYALCRVLRANILTESVAVPAKDAVLKSLRLALSLERGDGAIGTRVEDPVRPRSTCLCHWCHGSPGAAMVFAEATRTFPEVAQEFAEVVQRCGDVVAKYGVLKKGLGLCHGVSGNGYALLSVANCDALPAAERDVALRRAAFFADFIVEEVKRGSELLQVPNHPASLYEGIAGAAYFLADFCEGPKGAGMPLFEKFSY